MARDNVNPISVPTFDHPSITGDRVVQRTMATTTTTLYSNELEWKTIVKTGGIMGLITETSGNASDSLAAELEFYYGEHIGWTTATAISVFSGLAIGSNNQTRLDTLSNFRDRLPFIKMRVKFTKTGSNATATIKSRITLL